MKIDKYLLLDGAMGTYYSSKQRPYSLTQSNLLDYNTILSIHREYILSGSQAITTNTFGIKDLNSVAQACKAAQDAVRDNDIIVLGSIGPVFGLETQEYIPIIETFIFHGITCFIFETFPEADTIIELSKYIKGIIPDSFIIASFAVDQNGYSSLGINYIELISKIKSEQRIDSYGLNCVSGPVHMKELAMKLEHSDLLCIQPNSGYPSYLEDKTIYIDNPEYFADQMEQVFHLGVKILGGCCGTTPKHIAALRSRLEKQGAKQPQASLKQEQVLKGSHINSLENKLMLNTKVILVEYDPPEVATAEEISANAKLIEETGADGITIADNPLGRPRADSALIASRLKRDTKDIAIIPHLTCRDRNTISIRSALIGLSIEKINNILCITGDPVPYNESIKGVYSFNSNTLLSYVDSINKENILGKFYLGAALNINANYFHLELERAIKKIKTGAKYFITQPCFSDKGVENIITARKSLDVPIIAGIMPIKSYRNASFVRNEISGIYIPDEVIDMYIDKTLEECMEISLKLSIEIADRVKDYVSGWHIITPPKGEKIVIQLIKELKRK